MLLVAPWGARKEPCRDDVLVVFLVRRAQPCLVVGAYLTPIVIFFHHDGRQGTNLMTLKNHLTSWTACLHASGFDDGC